MKPPQGGLSPREWLIQLLLAPLTDARDRAEFLFDLEALRRERRRGRTWFWYELFRIACALRFNRAAAPSTAGHEAGGGGRVGMFFESIMADVRLALRMLGRAPVLTLVALPTIALAIGATTVLFSFADALLLRPLPVREPDRLLSFYHVSTDGRRDFSDFSYPDYVDLREQSRRFTGIAARSGVDVRLGIGREAESVQGQIVSGNHFDVLGVTPELGRTFLPEEDRTAGTHAVVIISRSLFERRFGADPSTVGESIALNGRSFTVIGVAPAAMPALDLETRPELWVPLMMHDIILPGFRAFETSLFGNRGTHWLQLMGRLPAGISAEVAETELQAIARRQAEMYPETNESWGILVTPTSGARTGPPAGRPLVRLTVLLAVVVAMVLLIACANIANLLLARASGRRQEMGVRLAIGASRRRLLRQGLTEATVLAGLGGCAGVLLAVWGMRLMPALGLTSRVPGLDVRLDARVLAFATGLALVTGILFGLFPALQASSVNLARSGRRPSEEGARRRVALRQTLVIIQLAFALVLLIGAGLTLRTLWNLQRVPLGFDPDDLLVARVDLNPLDEDAAREIRIYEQIADGVRSIPGVRDVSLARVSPFSGLRMANDIFWESDERGSSATRERMNVDMNVVDGGYFRTMGIPVLTGRVFGAKDRAGASNVAIVNQALAARLWPGEDAVGKTIWDWRTQGPDRALEVVGVVANGRYYRSWRNADQPFVFLPLAQNSMRAATLHMRASGGAATAERVREALRDTDPAIPIPEVRGVRDAMADALALQRTNARLLGLFGGLAALMSVIGVYGVVSFTVSQRTHEIGVRMALGARPADIRRLVVLGSARPIVIGGAIGWIAAAALTGYLAPFLYGVAPRDPLTFGLFGAVLAAVGLAATYIPAWRATRLDPLLVLRD
jgi:predicted permease